jgi:ligand-binding sensor domain-containing protein
LFSGKEWTDDSNISIGALAGDKNKNMWVGLNWGVGGVVKYTPASSGVLSEGTWGKVMSFPGYAEVHVTAMVRDRDGNIWVGTNHGLGKIPHDLAPATPLPALLTYNGDLKSVSSLAYDEVNHVLWIGQKGSAKALFRRQLGL